MRPEILFPLFRPLTALAGVGPRIAKAAARLDLERPLDLLWHLPSGLLDRRFSPPLDSAPDGVVATLTIEVGSHLPAANRRLPYRVMCHNESGEITLVFFHARPDYLLRVLPEGASRVVSGRLERFRGELQMSHPDHIGESAELERIQTIEPVYPLTAGLTAKALQRAMNDALAELPELPVWLDPAQQTAQTWPHWRAAVQTVHAPAEAEELEPLAPARARLAYDELLANQLALALMRRSLRRRAGRATRAEGSLRQRVIAVLDYQLTAAQERTLGEIDADLAAQHRMLRLLQGDVGSGKTIVALLAMLTAVEAGAQATLMAPTEILARQHFASLEPLARSAGVELGLLLGRGRQKGRAATLRALAAGEIDILVGTHAIFQQEVEFADLAFAVIDEQHRFGVHQRLALSAKGAGRCDLLVMTATPIPRTLALTAFGDMETSRLDEKPPGRLPVETRALPLERLDEVVGALERHVASGARVYWVCPLVAESELSDLAAAEQRQAHLAQRFGQRVALVHGRMKSGPKDEVMARFAAGEVDILVATTVIEVGVDVPEATVMVIEHAERFGLAQLHQLRGRVGRGAAASSCLMLYAPPLGPVARQRLEIMRQTEDGFLIAEEDLKLRGAGEVLGTRQSGLPAFRLADLGAHGELLATARDDARLILERDGDLTSPRGQALRVLLYLFERDAAVAYLVSG